MKQSDWSVPHILGLLLSAELRFYRMSFETRAHRHQRLQWDRHQPQYRDKKDSVEGIMHARGLGELHIRFGRMLCVFVHVGPLHKMSLCSV